MEVDERKKREDGKRKSMTKFPLTIVFPPSFVEECCNFIPTWSNPKIGFLPPPHKRVHASDRRRAAGWQNDLNLGGVRPTDGDSTVLPTISHGITNRIFDLVVSFIGHHNIH
jgi:hypothetical protein